MKAPTLFSPMLFSNHPLACPPARSYDFYTQRTLSALQTWAAPPNFPLLYWVWGVDKLKHRKDPVKEVGSSLFRIRCFQEHAHSQPIRFGRCQFLQARGTGCRMVSPASSSPTDPPGVQNEEWVCDEPGRDVNILLTRGCSG